MEAMKMEHEVRAELSGVVERLGVGAGDTVFEGHPLIVLRKQDVAAATSCLRSTCLLYTSPSPRDS